MYKKVEFEAGKVMDGEKVIGTEEGTMNNGTVVIEKCDGTFIFAQYGTMLNSEFYPFCRGHKCTGCKRVESPNCRYNQKTSKNAGYYAEF